MKHRLRRSISAATITAALVLGSAAAAHATPTPNNGPEAGGTTVTVPEPAGVTITSISAGSLHSLAIDSEGNAYAWGTNWLGQLGDGTNTESLVPVLVQAPAGVTFTSISAGNSSYSLAIGSDGNTYAWGSNWIGQLGDGTNTDSNIPVQVQAPAGVTFTSISAGSSHSLAIGSDGNTYSWGVNSNGQLGEGTNTSSNVPVLVQAPAGVTFTSISASNSSYSLAIGSDGNTYAWGSNSNGQLGDGTNTDSYIPVQVQAPAGVTFTSISASNGYSLAIGSDGNTYAWGWNSNGQLGDGTNTDSYIPVQVQAPAGVTFTSISAGGAHSLAIGSDGNTYAWGGNANGELGDGANTQSLVPVLVQAPAGVTFTSISAGSSYSLAIGSDGNTYAWGGNWNGVLGNDTFTGSNVPVRVLLPEVVVTGITFDGLDGTNLVDNGDGTWSVDTPAHAAGPVDVVVSWTLGGVTQTPVTYTGGFTYNPTPVAPTITNPTDQSVTDGDTATFSVTVTGTPAPTVVWEVSRDGGTTWETITADPAATPSADGLTLSVVGSSTNNGFQYRATATNSAGDVTSQSAKLTVTQKPVVNDPSNPEKSVNSALVVTGSEAQSALLIGALVALLLGTGIITANRIAKRRVHR